ncbi:MAG TPA: formate dehydrogenase accessory protein FdhE [Methylomirabilota bacterium]|nr:formate dehydrogenase accessory protein FdhE [Methylomirabilota bacterium]
MPDYAAIGAEWEDLLQRRSALREPLEFWTAILERWLRWKGAVEPLRWGAEECRARWERGMPLLAECEPGIAASDAEELLGPVMERLAADGPEAAQAFQRFAEAWDRGEVGPAILLPKPDRDPVAALQERFGIPSHLGGFLGVAALRPALETYFEGVRALPEGVWTRGVCPWCGGLPCFGDLIEDGRRRLSCPLCGGAWIAPRLRCPFCETWDSKDLVRLVAEGVEEGYFIEACRACRGYIKGVDRRQRWNAAGPLVEDWGSPHLDMHARREGYWRPTPCLIHLLPPEGDG